jgi:UDP-N-acetylglucosamine:LPS N-acetylglucosamine transferase
MKTVILTSGLGYGHTRAGEAVAAALRARHSGAEVETIDFWTLMAPKVSAAVKEAYLELVSQAPAAYEQLYQRTEKDWQERFRSGRLPPPLDRLAARTVEKHFPEAHGRLALRRGTSLDETLFVALLRRFLSPRQRVTGRLVGWGIALGLRSLLMARLLNRLQTLAPDAVVATQMLPATLLSYIRDNGELVDLPSYGVLTDYGVHDFWARSGLDCLCVAHEELAAELRKKGTGSAVEVTGMPLMPEFQQPVEPEAARQSLGLAVDRPTILVTGGAYGIGVRETLEELLVTGPDWQIVATTGGSEPIGPHLAGLAARHRGRLLLLDWCRNMAPLVSAADLVVGKPGGLTISEALACGRPFLAVCSLAGQESHNVRFLVRRGVGLEVGGAGLAETVRRILADAEELRRMGAAALAEGRRDGAERIARLIEARLDGARPSSRWAVP